MDKMSLIYKMGLIRLKTLQKDEREIREKS